MTATLSFIESHGGYPYATFACAAALTISNTGLTDVFALIGSNGVHSPAFILVQKLEIFTDITSQIGITVFKRTTLSTATITVSLPICQNNSTDNPPMATADFYETVATVGTGVALESVFLEPAPGKNSCEFKWGPYENSESITLNNANESLCVNLEGAFPSGSHLRIKVRWTELGG